ncbi:MAG TPA: glycosyltransferase family 39 protein [Verrucomicrobiae bacterium]|nr:glycosyltransferase family 39 protein [Verrucomicrobiae bacterium]
MAQTGGVPESTIQTALFQIEMGRGKKVIQWALLVLLAATLSLIYTASQFRGLDKRESMDMAQLARNIARGQGYTTSMIRPLGIWALQTRWAKVDQNLSERNPDLYNSPGQKRMREERAKGLTRNHPDLYNPPLYPAVLAGLFKLLPDKIFKYDVADRIYPPERWVILPFDQLCLLVCVLIVFLWGKRLFDRRVAVMAAVLMLFSDTLWSYGVSGLPTTFLMLLVLLAAYCLYLADERLNPKEPAEGESTPAPAPVSVGVIVLVLASAVLMGLAFLTRYLSAFLLLPMIVYAARVFRGRAAAVWSGIYIVIFLAVITPWLVRNEQVSGSLLGIARFGLIDRTGAFQSEVLPRSYKPDFTDSFSMRAITSKFLTNTRTNLLTNFRLIGSDFLVFFFGVGLMYGFRRQETSRLRRVLVGLIVCALFGMSLIGHDPERNGPQVSGGNLLVLFLPLVAIFGVAFFYLLLDRIPFRVKLTRGVAIGGFVLLNVSPMIFTMLPPRQPPFPYPPYLPPITKTVADLFETNSLGCSDLPWSMAWVGDRRTVWLPMSLDDFYEINDFVATKGFQFMFLTPYMLDARPQSEVLHGEYKGWAGLMRGQLPQVFPLKAATMLPGMGVQNEQILLADRVRWGKKESEAAPPPAAATPQGATNAPAPSLVLTNQPATPGETAPAVVPEGAANAPAPSLVLTNQPATPGEPPPGT